jgi:hypothetical protein
VSTSAVFSVPARDRAIEAIIIALEGEYRNYFALNRDRGFFDAFPDADRIIAMHFAQDVKAAEASSKSLASIAEELLWRVRGRLSFEAVEREVLSGKGLPASQGVGSVPAPAALPYGASPAGAEQLVCDWMCFLGETQAAVTQQSSDGGIDVVGQRWIAQVKHYVGSVGAPEIRELLGVSVADGRRPVFFSSGNYTAEAIAFADRVEMPLLTYSAERGSLRAANAAGQAVLNDGL